MLRESLKRVPRATAMFVVCCQLQEGSGEVCGWGSREGLGRGNTPQCLCAGGPSCEPFLTRAVSSQASRCCSLKMLSHPLTKDDLAVSPSTQLFARCKSACQGGPDRLCGFPRLPIPNGSLSSIPFDFTLLVIKD